MKQKLRPLEVFMNLLFFVCGLIAVVFVLFISIYLIVSGLPAIREIGLVDFLFGTEWASTAAEPKFGILPFILTSIYGTAGAIVLGVPVGFMTLSLGPRSDQLPLYPAWLLSCCLWRSRGGAG